MSSVHALEAAVAQHVAAIHRAASAAPAGGGPEWDALLRHYGLAPLDAQERAFIVSHMRLTRGAVPAEVRAAFVGLARWAHAEMDRLRGAGQLAPPSLHQRIAELADQETVAYERSVGLAPAPAAFAPPPPPGPAAPSLASIFANAQATSKEVPWANMKYDAVANLTCMHCGGPQEQPQDFMCKYCRRPIAGAIKPTA